MNRASKTCETPLSIHIHISNLKRRGGSGTEGIFEELTAEDNTNLNVQEAQ